MFGTVFLKGFFFWLGKKHFFYYVFLRLDFGQRGIEGGIGLG